MTRTRQEIFDLAWNGLKAQGFRQSVVTKIPRCRYRSAAGNKCAIGHCIPDHAYRRSFEGASLEDVILPAARIASADTDFAYDLQDCHDRGEEPDDMKRRLADFASRHSLTIPS